MTNSLTSEIPSFTLIIDLVPPLVEEKKERKEMDYQGYA